MKYLLDTHTFIWSIVDPNRLSEKAKDTLVSTSEIYVSIVALWEISIKYGLGKLELRGTTPEALWEIGGKMNLKLMLLSADDTLGFYRLERIHRDPFDRMLVWQSIKNNLVLLSKDDRLNDYTKYGLKLMW